MKEFFETMDYSERIFWYIAIAASIVFVIQTIMTFIGTDSDTGGEADFDGNLNVSDHPFQLFSLRNLIHFLLGFGWTGVSLYNTFSNKIVLGLVALGVGVLFVVIFFMVIKGIMRLAEDNTFNIEDSIGQTADVYMTIPAGKKGKGKVFISVKGTTHELDAITASDEPIKTGALVKITRVEGGILVVDSL